MRPVHDLTGRRFGRLSAIRQCAGQASRPRWMRGAIWLCRCDCGKRRQVLGRNLRAGKTRSCGCLRAELAAERILACRRALEGRAA